ncbi:MAG: TSUP family transporter [Myxococcaceae bacterium]|nr:TSUP family transporter [Myxococcaceae bacterium]
MTPELPVLLALAGVAFAAGTIDAIAGGGGLVTVPALLAAGLPPHLALGTNKAQSVLGALTSMLRYWRAGLVDARQAKVALPAGALGALAGAALVLQLDPAVLKPVILGLLLAAGGFMVAYRPGASRGAPTLGKALGVALLIGAYDGFFGPGTGTFLIIAFVGLMGRTLEQATADAKVVNFASNAATVGLMAFAGKVLWPIALPMAVGQIAGGYFGASLGIKGGARLIRPVVVSVVVALVLKLSYELWTR